MNIGDRLREVRKANQLSQRQLAQMSGVTNGMISLIEQNSASPTVSSLTKILDALSMSLADFFASNPSVDQPYIYRAKDQLDIKAANDLHGANDNNITYRVIGSSKAPVEMIHEIYEPSADDAQELYTHNGFEAGIVIEGEIEVTIESEIYLLAEGDGFSFPSNLPHCFRNIGTKRARIVSAAIMSK